MTREPVYLVGAGPGAPDLLTVRAARVLARADALLYDRLVHPDVVALATQARVKVAVGKSPGAPKAAQEAICATLQALWQAGYDPVVRLKGGDPFVFGRGGEEAAALSAAGIPWEVVPGLSAALAAPALAHIPVTHRGVSPGVVIVSGTAAGGRLHSLAGEGQTPYTLVVLMGVARLEALVRSLIAGGKPPDTPAALLAAMAWPEARAVRAPLAELPAAARAAGMTAPATLVVGPVAALFPLPSDLRGAVDAFAPG